MFRRFLYLFILLGISTVAISKGSDFKLDANVSRKEVKVGQSFTYRIILKVSSGKLPRLTLPQFHNFRLMAQSSQQNYVIRGRKTEISLIMKLELVAIKEGEFTLPPVSVKYRGKTFTTPSVEIKVKGKTKHSLPLPQKDSDIEEGAVSI